MTTSPLHRRRGGVQETVTMGVVPAVTVTVYT